MKQTFTFLLLMLSVGLFAQSVKIGGTTYGTINEAITAANDGDVIEITGIHTQVISIDKSITLRGTDPANDIIQASANKGDATERVITLNGNSAQDLNITIENIGVRNGVSGTDEQGKALSGGGIFIDKITNKVTLMNLIIEDNSANKNGGGIGIAGSNVDIIECTIRNNEATLDAGGIHALPNNGAGANIEVNLKNSLISNNSAVIGGGLRIDGNHDYGDKFLIDFNIENTTICFNNASNKGAAAFVWGVDVVSGGGNTVGATNVSVIFNHVTIAKNTSGTAYNYGLTFDAPTLTQKANVSIYNSIIVADDALGNKALNFAKANVGEVVNSIVGGQNKAPVYPASANMLVGKTFTFTKLNDQLTNEGGKTSVLALLENSPATDLCTASHSAAVLVVDQRGFDRSEIKDAGAYEYSATLANDRVEIKSAGLYPNPSTSGDVTIKGVSSIKNIQVYSITGSLVKEIKNSNKINVDSFVKGVYLVKINAESGVYASRLLVE